MNPPSDNPGTRPEPDCSATQQLMLLGGQRDLGEIEARRIEQHVQSCAACQHKLGGDGSAGTLAAVQDRLLREQPRAVPSLAEWEAMRATLHARLGLATSRASAARGAPVRHVAPQRRWWAPLLPLAAGLAIVWLVVETVQRPTVTADPTPYAEVSDLPDDQSCDIFLGEPEDGVLVFISSG